MAQANINHDYIYSAGSLCFSALKAQKKKPVTNVWQKLTE